MKKLFTLSLILFTACSLAIANPRAFPNKNNGNNKPINGNNQHNNSNSNSSSNYQGSNHHNNNNNYGSNHGPSNHHGNNHGNNNNHYGNNHGNNNNHYGNHHGNHYPSYPRPVVVVRPRPVIVNRPVYIPRPVVHVNVPRPNYNNYSSNYQAFNFKDLMYTLRNQNFDSDKLSIARQALSNNYFDTYQIREIMSVMDFEKNRVEFAKDAYNNCVDKQNFFRVNDAFEFSSSIRELEDYIFTRR